MVDFSHTLYFEGKLEVGLGIRYIEFIMNVILDVASKG